MLESVRQATVLRFYTINLLEDRQITPDAFDKLCKLFECEVSDLLEFLPDEQ